MDWTLRMQRSSNSEYDSTSPILKADKSKGDIKSFTAYLLACACPVGKRSLLHVSQGRLCQFKIVAVYSMEETRIDHLWFLTLGQEAALFSLNLFLAASNIPALALFGRLKVKLEFSSTMIAPRFADDDIIILRISCATMMNA